MTRAGLGGVRRLVVKVGTSSVTDQAGTLDPSRIDTLCEELSAVAATGRQVVLVTSGAIAAGLEPLGLKRRPTDMPSLQAAAAVGQALLMHAYQRALADRGLACGQVLVTRADFFHRATYVNARHTLLRLLELGAVPVVNENDTVAVDEIRMGENDRLAALVSHVADAQLLVLLSDIDGLHDGLGGELVDEVDDITAQIEAMAGGAATALSSGGMRTKIDAAKIATKSGIPTIIARSSSGILDRILSGRAVGTYFHPTGRLTSRKAWIAHATVPAGVICVDQGAMVALNEGKRSLLAAGVFAVAGEFAAGDAVDITGPDGVIFARGLVGFAADELRAVAGSRGAYREVVHRDDLVIV